MQMYLTRTVAVLAGVCAVAVFVYGVCLLLAVSHTAARSAAQKQVATVVARLGGLEMQYLSLTKGLTPERAQVLGFIPAGSHTTVFAAGGSHALSFKQ